MELASKIRAAINSNNDKEIRAVYLEVFGSSIKERCGDCYNKAIEQLIKKAKEVTKTNQMISSKYKFIKGWEFKKVTFKVGETRVEVHAGILTDELAEVMKANGRGHLLEENKGYISPNVVKGVKKITPETFTGAKEKQQLTLSTLKEAESDWSELNENVSEKELNTEELKPLTAETSPKKRGRKPKVSA